MAKQDDYVRYTIRVPKEVFGPLEDAAHDANRSANAEIIERLAFSIANPPKMIEKLKRDFNALDDEINVMEGDLKEQAENIRNLLSANQALKNVIDGRHDFERRLMFHVLNYIDEIPEELAIWAYDIAQISGREEILSEQIAGREIPDEEARLIIKRERDEFKKEYVNKIKTFLSEGEDKS